MIEWIFIILLGVILHLINKIDTNLEIISARLDDLDARINQSNKP